MYENIRQVIDLAKTFKEQSNEILKTAPGLLLNLNHVMDRLIGGLSHAAGIAPPATDEVAPQPLTHIAGKPIRNNAVKLEKAQPTAEDLTKIETVADEAFTAFQTMSAPEIRSGYDDLTIRAVAAKAGMFVTPTEPKTINIPYIEKVKVAVAEAAEKIRQDKEASESATNAKKEEQKPAATIPAPAKKK